jgi:hypothetical protein
VIATRLKKAAKNKNMPQSLASQASFNERAIIPIVNGKKTQGWLTLFRQASLKFNLGKFCSIQSGDKQLFFS